MTTPCRCRLPWLIPLILGALFASAPSVRAQDAFDHGALDRLLGAHVTEDALVDYDAFGAAPDFRTYLEGLAQAGVEAFQENEQLAFWINAYNAYTIELIHRHGERTSIRNINKTLGLFGGKGPWREAYTGERVEEQLHDQARRFLRDEPAKNRVDVATGTVHLSPIFDWYREDFPAGDAALGRYLAAFLPPGEPRVVLEGGAFRVKHTPYDWSLNIVR